MAGPRPVRDLHSRRIPRQATYISPLTGQKVKRVFSLRDASRTHDAEQDGERQPLLGNGIRQAKSTWRASTSEIARRKSADWWAFAKSTTGQGILKCSLAYLLGSLATFVPAIAGLIGKIDTSKHMVATVTVWFHPARTIGSMHEGTILALIGFIYACFVSFTSMGLSMFFAMHDLLAVGHVIVLLVFLGGGLGFIAWTKQHFGHPLVNVACSLASLGCVSVLVKEGSVQAGSFDEERVVQILIMVIMGIFATTLVNLIVLPLKARRRLHQDFVKSTDQLGELLINITRAFLVGEEEILNQGKQIARDHEGTLTSMSKNLTEAQREHYFLGSERQYHIEAKLAKCLSRLSQNLGGLRSAASTQFAILDKAFSQAANIPPVSSGYSTSTSSPAEMTKVHRQGSISRSSILDVITEDPEEIDDTNTPTPVSTSWDGASTPPRGPSGVSFKPVSYSPNHNGSRTPTEAMTPAEMFVTFINELGPPAKALAYTLKQILDELQFDRNGMITVNDQFSASLRDAIELYRNTRKVALETLYKSRALSGPRPMDVLADLEEVAASCGHFSFSLLDFAEECLQYLDALEELRDEIERSPKHRTWRWLMFWRDGDQDEHTHNLGKSRITPRYDKLTGVNVGFAGSDEADHTLNIPVELKRADDFADPGKSPRERPWSYNIYKLLRPLRRDDVKFAIKVGVGAALYALPAFLPSSRPFFTHWRGEWGLISYMVVCSMTIGASNTTGANRFMGTLMGAFLAVLAWIISSDGHGNANPWLLGFFGWLVSVGCFYIILAQGNGPMGRFILLTYNLGALYAYSLSVTDADNDDDEGGIDPAIWEIVLHRVVSVIVGCIWGIVVTRFIWPISARRKLKDGLCILWLRMSLIWKRDPLAMFLLGEPKSAYMDIREEAELQGFLSYLDSLRKAAASEFELRGPFPDKITGRIVERTKRMLEAFHAMNVVISKSLRATPGEAAVLR